jgi:ABC-type transport system substrate-binding protein
MHVWPDLPQGTQFVDSVQRQYPRVVVGVTMPAAVVQPHRLHDWAARRSSRLVYRTLMEFVGRGTEGGEYDCPMGTWDPQRLNDGRTRLVFQLTPDLRWSAGAGTLTGPVLARELLAMADPAGRVYQPDWAERLDQVSVEGVYTVNADLGQPHVRPAALLRAVVVQGYPSGDSGGAPLFNGPYVIQPGSDEEVVYLANPQYFAAGPNQPKEIVEHYYRKGTEAIGALQRRQIDVLDRVNPWDLEKVREIPGVVVEPYAVPLVHCLVANPRKPLTARRKASIARRSCVTWCAATRRPAARSSAGRYPRASRPTTRSTTPTTTASRRAITIRGWRSRSKRWP